MLIKRSLEVTEENPTLEGTKGCTVRWLIAENDGAKRYAMRLFELKPEGIIPLHSHVDKEHEIFVIEGKGILESASKTISIQQGDVIFIDRQEVHSFINNSTKPLRFICVIPR